jgi:hypothetical protein
MGLGIRGDGMDTQATNLEDAENDVKRLMDDVSRAMNKAQEAVATIAPKAAAATADTESTTTSR